MINKLKENLLPIVFFITLSGVILWQMLLPGYILTLDMIFTPVIRPFVDPSNFYNNLPFIVVLQYLNYLLPAWLIQKLILFLIFFLSGYFAFLRLLPSPKKDSYRLAAYLTGIFYAANPFVYQRFLAGHWLHLLSYVLLPLLVSCLIDFFRRPTIKSIFYLTGLLLLIGLLSLHYLVISLIVIIFYGFGLLLKNLFARKWRIVYDGLFYLFLFGIIFLIISSYWLIPYITNFDRSVITTFNQENWQAFQTAGDQRLGTVLNVLSLYGFWAENQVWAGYFLWPKDNFVLFIVTMSLLSCLMFLGILKTILAKHYSQLYLFLGLGLIGLVLSCGLAPTIFRGLNLWLFENVWFWSGFRDTEKFSALLALSYAFFAGMGVVAILEFLGTKISKFWPQIVMILCILPIAYTYTIWGGFARQLQPVWYPNSWQEANIFLNQDKNEFQVLFLPWHQYFSLKFNKNIVTQNPAKAFFDKEIIQGENVELGQIYSYAGPRLNREVEKVLLESVGDSQSQTLVKLKSLGIKYIILSHDLDEVQGLINFKPSESPELRVIKQWGDLTIFEIEV